ncbi:MAG: type III-B CRISPR module-associated protein Cmr5 [Aquificaceae bacterium]|nr:type III-B CRISPR module-associated protein Cmr5 [Aquificaceae bacterium]
MRTLNQERGLFALNEVSKIKSDRGKAKKYKSYAKKLPALIATNGLIATLAFLKSKSDAKDVYDSVVRWLKQQEYIESEENGLEELLKVDCHKLRLATMETLAFASWLKRIVEIEIEEDENE